MKKRAEGLTQLFACRDRQMIHIRYWEDADLTDKLDMLADALDYQTLYSVILHQPPVTTSAACLTVKRPPMTDTQGAPPMNNPPIADILRQARKASRLSVKQAASQLKHYGIDIASKTLYGYESGLSMPNADVFVALCRIYQYDSTADPAKHTSFSQDELSFLNDYKQLDPFGQDLVRQILEHEKERLRQIKNPAQRS